MTHTKPVVKQLTTPLTNARIRQVARQLLTHLTGRFWLFLTPVLLNIFLIWVIIHQILLLSLGEHLQFQANLLPNLLRFLILLFSSSASLLILAVIRQQRLAVGFSDSTIIFRRDILVPFIRVILARWFLLLPWSIAIEILAIMSLPYLSKGILTVEVILLLITILLLFLIKTYQAYTYSMSIYLLFDQLGSGQPIKAFHLVKASKYIMTGHIWRYIRLDWSFLGWHILTALTLGAVSFYSLPYRQIADIVFYQDLIQILAEKKEQLT